MLEKCSNCGARVVAGKRRDNEVFCSNECEWFFVRPDFCDICKSRTTIKSIMGEVYLAEDIGDTFTFNIGTQLYGGSDMCPHCGSIVQRLFFCVLDWPVIPLGKYLVKYETPRKYFGRKLRDIA